MWVSSDLRKANAKEATHMKRKRIGKKDGCRIGPGHFQLSATSVKLMPGRGLADVLRFYFRIRCDSMNQPFGMRLQ